MRLRRPHALANPGAPDAERGFVARRYSGFASVVKHPENHCAAIASPYGIRYWRARFSRAIDAAGLEPAAAAIIKALAVADRSALNERQRRLLRATGVGHLLAISGLHISLCAAWTLCVVRLLVALLGRHAQHYPAVRVGWIAALLAALCYAALAGFGIAACRAAGMVSWGALAALRGRRVLSIDNLLIALVILATQDPFTLLANGTWLSFLAVAILIALVRSHDGDDGRIRRLWRTHWMLCLGLTPLVTLIFGELSLVAPVANMLAVPFASVFIVPLTLLGMLLSTVSFAPAAIVWDSAARLWIYLEATLEFLATALPPIPVSALINATTVLPIAFALVLLSLPRALATRILGAIVLVAALGARQPALKPGAFRVTVLDVGQGLAVLVATRHHLLLYDAGPSWWGRRGDAGSAVVVPALQRIGSDALDTVAISHTDSDHVGGLASILATYRVGKLYAPPRARLATEHVPCYAGYRWSWDGVEFEWLHPLQNSAPGRNNASCVLAVRSPFGTALLSGDVELPAERELLARARERLRADLLIVPHHGSKSSSTSDFVTAVRPRFAVVSSGYGNRYGMPHAAVIERYRAIGSQLTNTATDGAVSVTFSALGAVLITERSQRHRFWTQAGLERQ